MSQVTVKYQQQTKEFNCPVTYYEVAQAFLVEHAVAAKNKYDIIPLDELVQTDEEIDFIDITNVSGYKIYQAGLKYLFQVALKEILEDSEVYFLHSVPKGILCEIKYNQIITNEQIKLIKGRMAKLVSDKERFIRYHLRPVDAYHYLLNNNEEEKALMIQYMNSDLVTMYRLKDNFNYFYNIMPYDTSVLDIFELIYVGNNKVVLVSPNVALKGRLPEYVHYTNIVDNFMNSKHWLKMIKTPYLAQLNSLVADDKIKDFILVNELMFQEDIARACEVVLANKKIKFVLIAGPSSSGKTTTMKRISTHFKSKGYDPVMLSTDDFFVNKVDTPKDEFGEYDFESLQAVDLELFNNTLKSLLDGYEVKIPTYDFISGKKIFNGNTLKLNDNSIILIEGIHCLNDELLPFISNEVKFKIYLSPFIPLNIDRHNYVSTLDLRLIRRITRDRRTRGKSVDDTILDWQKVRNAEEKHIFPYVYQADMVINTALSYEPGLLKVYALPLLYSVSIDSPCYTEARRLIKMLDPFFTISSELVPKDSILREFIGKED